MTSSNMNHFWQDESQHSAEKGDDVLVTDFEINIYTVSINNLL